MIIWPTRAADPAPLAVPELRALTERVAAEVRAGLHEVQVRDDERWYRLLCGAAQVDVWLLSWAREQAAELHDHAEVRPGGRLRRIRSESTEGALAE